MYLPTRLTVANLSMRACTLRCYNMCFAPYVNKSRAGVMFSKVNNLNLKAHTLFASKYFNPRAKI